MQGSSLTAATNFVYAVIFALLLGLVSFATLCYYVISWLVS